MDKPKSIAIVGYSNINLKFAKFSQADELWTMNHHVFLQERLPEADREIFRCDRLFELHKPEWFTRKEVPNALLYREWLREKKPFPIYMLEVMDEFPSAVRFPREALKEELARHLWRDGENVEYYTSTVALMIAFAIHLGVERIEFYGVEALTDTEYGDQKPCLEFWIGMAAGRGIDIIFHPTCSLCNAQVYGYEGVPHIVRKRLADLEVHYKKLMDEAIAEADKEKELFNSGQSHDSNKAMNAIDMQAMYTGAYAIIQSLQQEHDEYISAQFLEEKQVNYKNLEQEYLGRANMDKSEVELLRSQKNDAKAVPAWKKYQDDRAKTLGYHGVVQVLKKLRDECRLLKPDHHLQKYIVE